MKKIRLVLFAVAAIFCCATASADVVSLGISGGTNTANYRLKGYDDSYVSNNTGYQVGANVSFKALMLTITPEVWYTRNKFTIDDRVCGKSVDVVSKSIDMPILVGFSFLGNVIRVDVGPTFSLYDYGEARYNNGTDDVETGIGRIHTPVGYVAGLRLLLARKIILGARYNGQFGTKENDFGGLGNEKIRYSSYTFSVGFKL